MHANIPGDDQFAPELFDELRRVLFDIHQSAGREVTYVTKRGEQRPYWANRFRQALQRSVDEDATVRFVEDLMTRPEPSRGFFYLKDAGRLDLTVEAFVVDETRPFHSLFSAEAVQAARARLAEHGGALAAPMSVPRAAVPVSAGAVIPGRSFDIRVTVGADGELTLALI